MEKKKAIPVSPGAPKSKVRPVEDLAAAIRNALIAQEAYSEGLEPAIALCAGNYHAYLKCSESVSKRVKVMYKIMTREGSSAYKTFPDIDALPGLSRAFKDSLKSLGLTLDTIEAVDADPLDKLTAKVGGILEG